MSILFGIIASFGVQGVKFLTAKFGTQIAGEIIFAGLFIIAIIVTLAQHNPTIWSFVGNIIIFLGSAEITYQKIISNISWLLPPAPVIPQK